MPARLWSGAQARALIFDFDGVIVESEHIKSRAFAVLYGEYGDAAAAAAVAYHEANGGISRRKKIRHLHETLVGVELSEEALETLCRRFSTLVEDEVVGCGWVPGARAARRAIRAPTAVRRFGNATGRTHPHRHHLDSDAVLFVGDAAADRHAARETGVRLIGRLADAKLSPFPPGTPVISDITQLMP
jgi:phosphoglycolate phosphatase-like HAD superfamily hydrolase